MAAIVVCLQLYIQDSNICKTTLSKSSIKMNITVANFLQPVAHFQNWLQHLQTFVGFPVAFNSTSMWMENNIVIVYVILVWNRIGIFPN